MESKKRQDYIIKLRKFMNVSDKTIKTIEKEKNRVVSLNDLFIFDLNYRREVEYIILETEIIKYFKLNENIRLFDLIRSKKHKNDIRVNDLVDLICELLP